MAHEVCRGQPSARASVLHTVPAPSQAAAAAADSPVKIAHPAVGSEHGLLHASCLPADRQPPKSNRLSFTSLIAQLRSYGGGSGRLASAALWQHPFRVSHPCV